MAMDVPTWIEHAETELARSGHRSGGARRAVLEVLGSRSCLTSAQDIHDALRADGRQVGLASVYRALDALATLRLVHRIDVSGSARYERADPTGDHHHHAICNRCGAMSAFEDAELEALIDALGDRLGYAVDGHDVVLRGTCPRCAEAGG